MRGLALEVRRDKRKTRKIAWRAFALQAIYRLTAS
jgi:hypothetical protein